MHRIPTHKCLRLLACVVALAITPGCDDLNSDEDPSQTKAAETKKTTTVAATTTTGTPAAASDDDAATKYIVASVTGNWYYKNEIMKLKQSGSSIQGTTEVIGFTNNPADPVQVPVPTVGSMSSDGTVKVDELLIYTKNPSKNFRIKKVGGLTAANTLTLDVIAGQKAHTQVWVRK